MRVRACVDTTIYQIGCKLPAAVADNYAADPGFEGGIDTHPMPGPPGVPGLSPSLSVSLPLCLSLCLSLSLSVCLSVSLSVCPSVSVCARVCASFAAVTPLFVPN